MDSLGDRMKANYENRYKYSLLRRLPVILRLDGKSFHTLTRQCEKPFDKNLSDCMAETAKMLCEEIQGARYAYTQSDEISILLIDYNLITTQAWFDYDLQKVVSISSAIASTSFTTRFGKLALFDSRAFNLPVDEVCNYFIWRQKDWIRNSVSGLAQSHFSHKQLHQKSQSDMHEMLFSKGINWNDLDLRWKNGQSINKISGIWQIIDSPIFTQDRNIIDSLLLRED